MLTSPHNVTDKSLKLSSTAKPLPKTAKVFMNGRSQAVRLPAQFRFDTDEVYIRKDEKSGDVILSKRPNDWDEFFVLLESFTDEDKRDAEEFAKIIQDERDKARAMANNQPNKKIFGHDWQE